MEAKAGDRIVVPSTLVGHAPREGQILEVEQTPEGTHFRVRWEDGHESFFMPKAGSARVIPKRKKRVA
jgi:hypothetical protein